MVVKNLTQFRIKSYKKLYKMYQNGELGCYEQRMLGDIARATEGTELEKIKSLLNQDTDNFYHVTEIIRGGKLRYLITIIGFSIIKTFNDYSQYCLTMGEDGVWEEFRRHETQQWTDGSNGSLELLTIN